MVNQQLVDYFKQYMNQGYRADVLYNHLIQQGYSQIEVKEALEIVTKKPSNTIKIILIGIAIILILSAVGFASYYFMSQPSCGNGELEDGEDTTTCCIDVGCDGEQTCTEEGCIEPTCGTCQYIESHECIDYKCCIDADCNDYNESTVDSCMAPGTKTAKCNYQSSFAFESDGTSLTLIKGVNARFNIDNELHTISIKSMNYERVTLLVNSTPVLVTLQLKDEKSIDLDEDGKDDLLIRLDSINGIEIKLFIKRLKVKCSTDTECDDGNFKTDDTCNYPGEINAYCSHDSNLACQQDKECEDTNFSTIDICKNNTCSYISECINSDSYCPSDCNETTDNDCIIKECELNTDCNDGNATTRDYCKNFKCYTSDKNCTNNDGLCPGGCTVADDNDCSTGEGSGGDSSQSGIGDQNSTNESISGCISNSECDDGNSMTTDICNNGNCVHPAVSTCSNDDGVCLATCYYEIDNDCEVDDVKTYCVNDSSCYFNNVTSSGNYGLCNNLIKYWNSSILASTCIYDIAYADVNCSLCNLVPLDDRKETCIANICSIELCDTQGSTRCSGSSVQICQLSGAHLQWIDQEECIFGLSCEEGRCIDDICSGTADNYNTYCVDGHSGSECTIFTEQTQEADYCKIGNLCYGQGYHFVKAGNSAKCFKCEGSVELDYIPLETSNSYFFKAPTSSCAATSGNVWRCPDVTSCSGCENCANPTDCGDGTDNNGNNNIDCDDIRCVGAPECS